jgi:AraC-like DNA-binding protein
MNSATMSIRMTWPFTRILNDYHVELEVLREAGIEKAVLADSAARIRQDLVWKLLRVSVEKTGNPALGLRAGQWIEVGDWGVIAHAAASCPTLRQSLQYLNRNIKLLDDVAVMVLVEQDDRAIWQFRYGVARPLPALNDFLVSSGVSAIVGFSGGKERPLEVHVIHPEPAYANEYARYLRAPVRFNAEYNAVVIAKSALDRPIRRANPDMFEAFDEQVKRQLEVLARYSSTSAEVQRFVKEQLGRGDIGMKETSKHLHMSVATLKRRLSEEGTTHSKLVDQIRHEFALRYLADRRLPIADVALKLGFSSTSAFGKAFKRWAGVAPIAYRTRAESSSD